MWYNLTLTDLFYILWGYCSGSILFARIFGWIIKRKDITADSRDQNPGVANAFLYGGFLCGVLTLAGDLMKGFLPMYCYLHYSCQMSDEVNLGFVLVMAAPIIGHIFPIFNHFRGGKGIAVTFGCLLGLTPILEPVVLLAIVFLFFSLILRVTPHYHRTILTYLCTALLMFALPVPECVPLGFLLITGVVMLRMWMSDEEKDKMKVHLLWRR